MIDMFSELSSLIQYVFETVNSLPIPSLVANKSSETIWFSIKSHLHNSLLFINVCTIVSCISSTFKLSCENLN